jgi:hypothetical protein
VYGCGDLPPQSQVWPRLRESGILKSRKRNGSVIPGWKLL